MWESIHDLIDVHYSFSGNITRINVDWGSWLRKDFAVFNGLWDFHRWTNEKNVLQRPQRPIFLGKFSWNYWLDPLGRLFSTPDRLHFVFNCASEFVKQKAARRTVNYIVFHPAQFNLNINLNFPKDLRLPFSLIRVFLSPSKHLSEARLDCAF